MVIRLYALNLFLCAWQLILAIFSRLSPVYLKRYQIQKFGVLITLLHKCLFCTLIAI